MRLADAALYHQIHPAKLGTDIGAALVSLVLLWQHHLATGLVVMIVPSVVASAVVIRFADLERLRASIFGRYISRWMTPTMQGVRIVGLVVSSVAAWMHLPVGVALGLGVTALAWAWGVLPVHGATAR